MKALILSALFLSTTAFCREAITKVEELLFEPVDSNRSRTVPVKVYLPAVDSPQPVIVFSHGLGGSRNNSRYLGKHWAEAGYVCVFVQHIGSDESVWKDVRPAERLTTMKNAIGIRPTLDRFSDIPFILDTLEKWNADEGHKLYGKLDLERIGMTGHSYGAVTTQAMMGQKFPGGRDVREERFDAFMPMSPSDGRGVGGKAAFGEIRAPVLVMTGTKDGSVVTPDTTPESRRIPYASLPEGDAYELVFDGGNHMAFSDREPPRGETRLERVHLAIQEISTKFWDAYLRGDEIAKQWLKSEKAKVEAGLTEEDVWQWK